VSGFLGTERISMNDNLLKRGSLPEIEMIMGHEMGHYVLHHVYHGILGIGLMIVAGFGAVYLVFERIRAATESRWHVRSAADVAGLPLLVLLISAYFFLITPVFNSFVRSQEAEADIFGLNAPTARWHGPGGAHPRSTGSSTRRRSRNSSSSTIRAEEQDSDGDALEAEHLAQPAK
jgi:hypothetical protein